MPKFDNDKNNLGFIKKSETYLPLFTGRPERDTIISEDEILNLVIALNTCLSAEEFINLM